MTGLEALNKVIEICDELQDNARENGLADTFLGVSKVKLAVMIMKREEEQKNADKYCWHDLRKNPNDLPQNGMIVECQHLPNIITDKKDLVVMHHFIDGKFVYNWDIDTDFESSTFGQRYYGAVIAWRDIEPFEEEK